MKQANKKILLLNSCLCALLAQTTACPALSNELPGSLPVTIQEHLPNTGYVPDVHFWTGPDGVPQLDYRSNLEFFGTTEVNSSQPLVNQYGGAINNGTWRGFRCFGGGRNWAIVNYGSWLDIRPDLLPPILELERRAMLRDDAVAANSHGVTGLELTQSGIFWGPQKEPTKRKFASGDGSVTREAVNGRSYLKGPVRIVAGYIRFDGPVSRIGEDVTLIARRIVVNGVELPPASWREALAKLEQSGTTGDAK